MSKGLDKATKALKKARAKAAEPKKEIPNQFQVRKEDFGDGWRFITFNFSPFLDHDEAIELGVQLIAAAWSYEMNNYKKATAYLARLQKKAISQREEYDY